MAIWPIIRRQWQREGCNVVGTLILVIALFAAILFLVAEIEADALLLNLCTSDDVLFDSFPRDEGSQDDLAATGGSWLQRRILALVPGVVELVDKQKDVIRRPIWMTVYGLAFVYLRLGGCLDAALRRRAGDRSRKDAGRRVLREMVLNHLW